MQSVFLHTQLYLSTINLRILIISYLGTFIGSNSLSVLMCRKAVNQSVISASTRSNRCTLLRIFVRRSRAAARTHH